MLMNVSDLIDKLARLQIEQDDIIQQLAHRAEDPKTETEARVTLTEHKKPEAQEADTEIRKGDHVLLLNSGVLCRKGDRALVTKVSHSAVHFVVFRNKHHTYKKHRNVQKIPQA
jgi:NCAIR mutase (PurE)-related protein